ncbi:MAG: acyltransferase [Pseudonocardia sp.]|nr:acyltransferase [Pseudonocardia sp.]
MATLQSRFDPRRNGLDVLRLGFAVLVAVSHGIDIHTGHQPQWGSATLGDFGLDGFFILSGFLVTRSFLKLDSLPRFIWHRFLRIMPGFWVCLVVVGLLVAPLAAVLQGTPASTAFTSDPSALRFVLGNAALLMVQYDIAGILANTPQGVSFNGALWTLFFEAGCYGLVAVAGVLGVLRRRRWLVAALAVLLAVLTVFQEIGVPILVNDRVVRLAFVFVLGMLAHLYAARIPMRPDLALAAAAVFLLSVVLFTDYRVLGAAPFAYACLWVGTSRRMAWSVREDLSYGIYIYHWPALQLMTVAGAAKLSTTMFVPLGIAVATVPAVLSWFLVEQPALSHKHSSVPDRVADRVLMAVPPRWRPRDHRPERAPSGRHRHP